LHLVSDYPGLMKGDQDTEIYDQERR
jgi:hypothetical protein